MIAPVVAPDTPTKQAVVAIDEAEAAAADRAERQWPQSESDESVERLEKVRTAREKAQRSAARADRTLRNARTGVASSRAARSGGSERTSASAGRHRALHALDAPDVRQHRDAVFELLRARAEREAERSDLEAAERAERRMAKKLKSDAPAEASEWLEANLPALKQFVDRANEERKAEQAEKRKAKKQAAKKRKAEKQAAKKRKAEERAAAAQQEARSAGRFRPATGGITSQYGMRVHPITGVEKLHSGTDFSAGDGNAYAARKGRVSSVYFDAGGYGNLVTINHGGGLQTRYAHLADPKVQPGERVKAGEVIGKIGSTGASTGPHLHFEVLKHGEFVNSLKWLRR
ncbi:MAG: M23 family metallopeptidase [Actinomycetota bacterium]